VTTARGGRLRLRQHGLDGVTLLLLPCVLFVAALFVDPFLYGLFLSFKPKHGGLLANYSAFSSDHFLYDTIWPTLVIAVPVTLLYVVLSIPVAIRVRLMRRQKLLTTILVIPVTRGTVLVAEGVRQSPTACRRRRCCIRRIWRARSGACSWPI